MSKQICSEVSEKYNGFLRAEKAWRKNVNKAIQKDKVALRQALSEKQKVVDAFLEIKNAPRCGYENAQEIMGEDFFGVKEIEKTFGFEMPVEIPPILFSAKELQEAKEHGEMLILRISRDNEGNSMTAERILQIMAARMPAGEKLLEDQLQPGSPELADDCWFKDESFFTGNPLKTQWVLVGKEGLGKGQNQENYNTFEAKNFSYSENDSSKITFVLHYLNHFRGISVNEYMHEHETFKWKWRRKAQQAEEKSQKLTKEEQRRQIALYVGRIREEIFGEFMALNVNQKFRRSVSEILFDWVIRFKTKNERGSWFDHSSSPPQPVYEQAKGLPVRNSFVEIGGFEPLGAKIRTSSQFGGSSYTGITFIYSK